MSIVKAAQQYSVVRTVGRGGMAEVYEAIATSSAGLQRRVALKRILAEFADDEGFRRMMLDEAKIAGNLRHANIVQVLDYGVAEGAGFIVFEFVDGINAITALRRAQRRKKRFPNECVLHIATEVSHALSYAHRACDTENNALNIVHRDVSPSNILLSWEGDVKLSDFGIAMASLKSEKTLTGMVKGKVEYMAPEQARGERVGPAADVFALGMTLKALSQHDDLDRRASSADAGLERLIQRCIDPDAWRRPSAASVATQAAELFQQTAHDSGRALLVEFLGELRSLATRRNSFDQDLRLLLVKTGENDTDFAVAAPTANATTQPATLASQRLSPPQDNSASLLQRRMEELSRSSDPWRKWTIAGVILVLLLAFLWLQTNHPADKLSRQQRQPTSSQARQPATLGAAGTGAQTSNSSPNTAIAKPPEDSPGALRQTSLPEVTPRAAKQKRQRTRREAVGSSGSQENPSESSSTPLPIGWVRVGGATLLRGRVTIDGKPFGYAPIETSLTIGTHRIVVFEVQSDEVLIDTLVDVREHHRRADPLRLIR